MEYKTIFIDGHEFLLVPKKEKERLDGKYKRTEQENGDFRWKDWSTGGVSAREEIALLER